MATKLDKNSYPDNHGPNDFECFGPVVTKDTEWGSARLCDLGCFSQEEVDSNKMYHLAAVKSKKTGAWFAYYEWGRTRDGRPDKPNFQFFSCTSEQDAMNCCEKQFHEKNTKRGTWEKIGSKERYVPKPKKDLYVVRAVARRLVGLPGAENIANEDAKGVAAPVVAKSSVAKKKSRSVDPPTEKLFRDLLGGAVSYTRNVMSGGKGGKVSLPTLASIEEAREILDDAMAQLKVVGTSDVKIQVADKTLKQLTYQLYGKIPKAKPPGTSESVWILSQENIGTWRLDLDTFETALQAEELHIEESESDVMQGIPARCRWLGGIQGSKWVSADELADHFRDWWIKATTDRNNMRGNKLKIHNIWEVERDGDRDVVRGCQDATLKEMPAKWNNERPMFQEKNRPDLTVADRKLFWDTNTALTFHGTRSVNVPGIIRENLRFPKELTGVIITGAMFGPGSYFADDWQKSANYCSSPRSNRSVYYGGGGEVKRRHAFMFAFDTVMGHPFPAKKAHGYTAPPAGHHCVFGKAGWTESWGRAGGLINNEWIIYRKGRCAMRYLAEVEW